MSLPTPKLLELSLFQNTLKFWARKVPSATPSLSDSQDWRWECLSSTPQPPHLFICQESLGVVRDHYTFLNITCRFGRKKIYCDYKRDTIYFSKENWEFFRDSVNGRVVSVGKLPVDVRRVSNLAISSLLPHMWLKYKFYGVQQFWNPGGRKLTCGVLEPVFVLFPKLSSFRIMIDGRSRGIKGSHLIIEASEEEHFDYYREYGREDYAEWISSVGKEFNKKLPNLRVPTFTLGVLTNEQPLLERIERRWDYEHATCNFCIPGFDGHRSVSRSPPPSGRANFFQEDLSSDSSSLLSEEEDGSEDAFLKDYAWGDSTDSDASRPRRGRGYVCLLKDTPDSDESDDEPLSAANANFDWGDFNLPTTQYPVSFEQTWAFAHPD